MPGLMDHVSRGCDERGTMHAVVNFHACVRKPRRTVSMAHVGRQQVTTSGGHQDVAGQEAAGQEAAGQEVAEERTLQRPCVTKLYAGEPVRSSYAMTPSDHASRAGVDSIRRLSVWNASTTSGGA